MFLKTWLHRENPLRVALRRRRLGLRLVEWEAQGRPAPTPQVVKHGLIKAYAARFGCKFLVETGTSHGDTVAASLDCFRKIWSIELSVSLAEAAKVRFAKQAHVRILQGDSGRLLSGVIPLLDEPTLFWLDGHYCGVNTAKGDLECPVLAELAAVFGGQPERDVVLIDDARLFTGANDYPTISQLRELVAAQPKLQLYWADDVIRIHRID